MNNNNSTEYVLTNKKEFLEWFNKNFIQYRATGKQELMKKKYEPYNYQKLLKQFMNKNSPYKGILLYHGLGTGKTCTSITIAENLKKERNVVVMLPASLKNNFIYKGLLFCGDEEYKTNESRIKTKYTFVSYNASNKVKQLKNIGSLDNKVIIIEEVHNLISIIMSGLLGSSKDGKEIYNMLMNANNTKIIALSGTPLINDPFEAAILFNILNGYNEILYYRIIKIPSSFGVKDFETLEQKLIKYKYIDDVKINKLNKSIEFILNIKSYQPEFQLTLDYINQIGNEYLEIRYLELKKYSLFPIEDDGELYKKYFVEENEKEGNNLKNENIFKKRIIGLVSYYKSSLGNYPKVIDKGIYRIPMSNHQFQIYEILRKKERSAERGSPNKKNKKAKIVKSTFRVFSRQSSNFVFPEEILRPYPDPKFVVSVKKINNKNNNKKDEINHINRSLELEEKLNNSGELSKDYKKRIKKSIDELVEKGDIYLRPGPNGLDKLSPKFKLLLENIKKSKGLVFIYSNFRSLEGVELFTKVLDFNGYSSFETRNDKPKYAIYSGSEDDKMKKKILDVFTSDENKNGKLIKIILATSAGAEGLDLKNIRQIHILEPYWNQMRIQQIIGRGVRRDSHIALPASEQDIEIYRYFSVLKPEDALISKDKLSTDEHIEEISIKKQKIINQMLNIFKECAFDCSLNAVDIKGNYKCFAFGKGAKGFSYYPKISDDIVYLNTNTNTKEVKKDIILGAYYQGKVYLVDKEKKYFYLYSNQKKIKVNINPKEAKPIYIDKENNLVYKKDSIKIKNPIPIAEIKNNKLIKI
jgi:superfamily II DNA or RNA helicase